MPSYGFFSYRGVLRQASCVLLACAALLPACAELPVNTDRPVSHALAPQDDTPLAQTVQTLRRSASARFDSGFLMLDSPQAAYGARLALIESARKTLDLQYYAIHTDASTGHLLRALRQAAANGVRVRILLDDFHSAGRNALVMRLAFEKNIEMRMFNPLAGGRSSAIRRMFNALDDAAELQQRMHNKLFIADNTMAITGGRNLGDAYFGSGTEANFIDLDVLSAGPIVRDFSRSFDDYWNNERAYPVQSLVTREELDKIRDRALRADEQAEDRQNAAPKPPDGEPRPTQAPSGAQQRDWDRKPMDLRAMRMTWAPAVVLADRPEKIPVDPDQRAEVPTAKRSPGLVVTQAKGRAPGALETVAAKAGAAAPDDANVVDGLLQLFGQARSELRIISPYFVPGPDMLGALAAAHRRGVRVRVLTNSLASNDAVAAHAGYARHREALLAAGIELYEMRSTQVDSSMLGSSGDGLGGSSRSMLHSKAVTLDDRLIVVGSMNLDLRSQLQNTEVALLIQSNDLTRRTNERIDTAFRQAAWKVELDDKRLIWRAPEQSGLADTRTEPDTGIGLRLLIRLFGPLAPDKLL